MSHCTHYSFLIIMDATQRATRLKQAIMRWNQTHQSPGKVAQNHPSPSRCRPPSPATKQNPAWVQTKEQSPASPTTTRQKSRQDAGPGVSHQETQERGHSRATCRCCRERRREQAVLLKTARGISQRTRCELLGPATCARCRAPSCPMRAAHTGTVRFRQRCG